MEPGLNCALPLHSTQGTHPVRFHGVRKDGKSACLGGVGGGSKEDGVCSVYFSWKMRSFAVELKHSMTLAVSACRVLLEFDLHVSSHSCARPTM